MFCRCADIATGYRNNVFAVTSQKLFCNTRFVYGKDTGFPSSRRSFCIPGEAKGLGGVKLRRGGLMIRAVATFQEVVTKSNQSSEKGCYEGCVKLSIESRSLECTAMEQQSETGNSTELDESVRHMRVPKANKRRVPWNKGRKHSPGNSQLFNLAFWFLFFKFVLLYLLSMLICRNIATD